MIRDSLKLDLYVGLTLIYMLSEGILGSGFVVTFSRWPLFFTSLFYFVKIMIKIKNKPLFITALGILYMMFFVYGVTVILEGKDFYAWRSDGRRIRSFLYLLQISNSLLPIFVFYYFSKTGVLTRNYVQRRMFVFLVAMCICYYVNLQSNMLAKGADEVTNNSGYLVLSFFPMVLFLKYKSMKQYIYMGICLLLILLAMKRGAIIIALLCLAIYFKYLFSSYTGSKLRAIVVLLVVMAIMYYSCREFFFSSDYFQQRVEKTMEGNSSGRDVIYEFFYNFFLFKTTQEELLFGRGANATLDIFGQYAHNDWLEIAINQGILGLVIYLIYWLSFLLLCVKTKMDPPVKAALLMLFVIYFLKTIFSMSYREYTIYSSMVLGYCVAMSSMKGGIDNDALQRHRLKRRYS